MNTLYVIGNGFDVNIGLKTKYADFYEYYMKVESKSKRIEQLKNNISANHKNWSDLQQFSNKLYSLR